MIRRLGDLAASVPASVLIGNGATPVSDIQYDSRLITPGSLFVALRGGYVDGHDFLPDALDRGAAAVVVDRNIEVSVPTVRVDNARFALSPLSASFFGHPSRELTVVGITGTDGKTTTSYLVDSILSHAGLSTGMIGTVSVKIADRIVQHETRQTTPESLEMQRILRQMVDAGVDYAILEATSHGLAQHRLDDVQFEMGAVTNITHEHLEFHKTVEAYRSAKAILFDRISALGGVAIVNLDDEGARSMLAHSAGARVLTYSCERPEATLFASNLAIRADRTTFDVSFEDVTTPFVSPLVGRFNVENALAAIGLGLAAGLGLEQIARGLAGASAIPGRMQRIDLGQPFAVIVDYAHTPESLEKLLTLLRELNPQGRIVAVSGSAGERDVEKRGLQGKVSARLADVSVFTSEDPRFEDAASIVAQLAAGAAAAGARPGRDFLEIVDRREAIAAAFQRARPGDTVLLAGKGHERSIIWNGVKISWDEPAVAAELLREAGYGREV